jgi:hypothetical protein
MKLYTTYLFFGLLCFGISCNFSFSQTVFNKVFYDYLPGTEFSDITMASYIDEEENIYIIGYTSFDNTGMTYFMKLDKDGNQIWYRWYGVENIWFGTRAVKRLPGGEFIFCGTLMNGSESKGFLMKVDKDGILLWSKVVDAAIFNDLEILPDGSFAIVGRKNGLGLLVITDVDGVITSSNTYSHITNNTYSIRFQKLISINDKLYILGIKTEWQPFAVINYVILKLSTTGSIVWSKSFIQEKNEINEDIIVLDNEDVLFGYRSNIYRKEETFVLKFKSNGSLDWQKAYHIGQTTLFRSFAKDQTGNVYIVGNERDSILPNWDYFGQIFKARIHSQGELSDIQKFGHHKQWVRSLSISKSFLFITSLYYGPTFLDQRSLYVIKSTKDGYSGCYDSSATATISDVNFNIEDINLELNPDIIELKDTTIQHFLISNRLSDLICSDTIQAPPPPEILQPLLYPNPNNGSFTLELPTGFTGYAEIYDVRGSVIFKTGLIANENIININLNLAPGLYILRIPGYQNIKLIIN